MVEKTFLTLKYEDREKLIKEKGPDSFFSHSACQIVFEKEAEILKLPRSCLADTTHSHNDNTDISGTTNLFPMEPHRISGGMISGHSQNYTNLEVQQCIHLQHNELTNVVIQGSSWKAATATQSTSFPQKKQQQQQKPFSKPWQGKKTWKKMGEEDR